ncbi:MAG TPA: ABC transporter substrate-binding protein [Thermomicrobiaceae bacterium]|nr:ABC transporter substrate-binding protein [Thermomicrobiaceae bacterium]
MSEQSEHAEHGRDKISWLSARASRRRLLRVGIGVGATISAAGLLAACGGGAASSPTTTSQSTQTSASTTTTSSGTGASTPAPVIAATPPPSAGASPQAGGELFYGLTNKFDTLDPNITTFSDVIRMANHMFDPLVSQAQAGQFTPWLAQKWEVSTKADQYTFTLRTDVKFHDGTPFDATAVKFTFDRIVDPNNKSQSAFSAIGPYDSSQVVDPATVVVKFKDGYAPFLDSCSQTTLAPVSPSAVQKLGKDFGNQPVGTGPFKFDSYKTDNLVRMVKNPDYNWAPSRFKHQGAPYLDAISFQIISEAETRLAALRSGQVQFMQDVPTQDYKAVKGDSSLQVLEGVMTGSGWTMMINVTKPPVDDVQVRTALEWGIDKAGMIKSIWQGLYQPSSSPLTSPTFGYDPATRNVYSYDATKAGQILDAAGWKMGSGGVRQKNGQDLTLGVYYRSDNTDFSNMATFLQAMYQQIGVKLDLHGLAQAGYFNAVRAGEHHLQFWWEPATDPDVVRVLFHSANADGGTNRNRYKNAEMDKLIDDAAATTDPNQRKTLYSQIQMKSLNEAIMVYCSEPTNVFAYQKSKLAGPILDFSATNPFFYDAWLIK